MTAPNRPSNPPSHTSATSGPNDKDAPEKEPQKKDGENGPEGERTWGYDDRNGFEPDLDDADQ